MSTHGFKARKGVPRKISFLEIKEKCGDCSLLVEDEGQWWCDGMNCWINKVVACKYWGEEKRR